ncbi:hypothetical protein [Roseateles sp.]|uniref:hypothetical protein n=1 Tax=Roseateles sp. TaxID=1971397 RepID=UPI0032678DC6
MSMNFAGIALTTALMTGWAPVQAAPSITSDVRVDWASLKVLPIADDGGVAPSLTWFNRTSQLTAYNPNSSVTVGDWTSQLEKSVGDSRASATASMGASEMHAYSIDTDSGGNTSGSIWALREGEFSVIGSGSVQLSVDYSWAAALHPTADARTWDSFAYAYVALRAETRYDPRSGGNRSDEQQANIQLLAPPQIGEFKGSGTLTINVPVVSGDYFYFTASASPTTNLYVSAVPNPPSIWLMPVGLLALMIMRSQAARMPYRMNWMPKIKKPHMRKRVGLFLWPRLIAGATNCQLASFRANRPKPAFLASQLDRPHRKAVSTGCPPACCITGRTQRMAWAGRFT